MTKWIPFAEFLKSENASSKYVSYTPDEKSVVLKDEETGARRDLTFKTQTDSFGWRPFLGSDGNCYLIANWVTDDAIMLGGKDGYDRGNQCIDKIASIYDCEKLGARGVGLTKKLYLDLPESHKDCHAIYILQEHHEDHDVNHVSFDQMYVCSNQVRFTKLYSGTGWGYVNFAIRPTILLAEDTLVNVGSYYFDGTTPERGLKLMYHGYHENTTSELLKVLNEKKEEVMKLEEEIGEI